MISQIQKIPPYTICYQNYGHITDAYILNKKGTSECHSLYLPQRPHELALLGGQQAGQRLHIGAAEVQVEVHAAGVVALPHLRRNLLACLLEAQSYKVKDFRYNL